MKNKTEGPTTAQAAKDEEIIMVRTQDGSMEDVRKINDSDLYETHLTHVNFLDSLIHITGEALSGTDNDPEDIASRFTNLVLEIDQRFDYIREIGYELDRRLHNTNEKTA